MRKIIINKSVIIKGSYNEEILNVNGFFKVENDANIKDFTVKGSFSSCNLITDFFWVNGYANINCNITSAEIKNYGVIKSNKIKTSYFYNEGVTNALNIEAENFKGSGEISSCETKVNKHFIFKNEGESKIDCLIAKSVKINCDEKKKILLKTKNVFNYNKSFILGKIVAEEINVNEIKAVTVKGNRVVVGKNCIIDKLEYYDSYTIDESSNVRSILKIDESIES